MKSQSGFRFREDVGFERRCPTCADWWPITLDFWDKRWTSRCVACIKVWRRVNQNDRYKNDAAYRDTRRQAAALTAWKDRQNAPDKIRERKAAYYRANAPRILEGQRIRYAAKKKAA